MITSARRLLKELDRLAFGPRQHLIAATARALVDTRHLDRLLAELGAGDEFARRTGVQLAYVARHHGHIEAELDAPHTSVRRAAMSAAVRLGLPGAVLASRIHQMPTALRRALYQAIRRRQGAEQAEALLPEVRARYGDHEGTALLPACRRSTVERLLPELEHAVPSWPALARCHPGPVLDHVDRLLDQTPRSAWPQVWQRVGSGVAVTVPTAPGRVLALLERTVGHAPLPDGLARTIGALARHDPERLLNVLLDPRRTGYLPTSRPMWRAAIEVPDATLIALARVVASDQYRFPHFLRTLPPHRRAAVYAGAVGGRDLITAGVPLAALDELPTAARATEARRLLGLRSVADDPDTRLAVTARLPWTECRDTLIRATRRATATERAAAYPLSVLAGAASRDPEVVGELLGTFTRLANEQDPVRTVALQALAEVPPWLFRADEAELLTTLMTDAVQARDCSWYTQRAVRALAGRLIREGALSRRPALVDAGLAGLERIGWNQSWLDLSGLDRSLPRGAEHAVFEALRPRLAADARRGLYRVTLGLADGLGRRAWRMPELQALLDQARSAADDHVVRRAIELWLEPPATRNERVGLVFAADHSTITLHTVCAAIDWRRTDLLDEVFSRPLYGRFLRRDVRFVPTFRGYRRWLPRQTRTYAELLTQLATGRFPVHERSGAVHSLGRVPGAAAILRTLLDDRETQVRDAALAALAWTDEPGAALPVLLAYSSTDRAHIAVSAATRCARFVLPEQLGAALGPVLSSRKITSRKEAARLVAEHRVPDAAGILSRAWALPDQHRDVRRALVSSARWFLDDARAWPLLAAASEDEPAVATALLGLRPETVAADHRAPYAGLVRRVADAADPDTARQGLATLPNWVRWDPSAASMLVEHVCELSSTPTWRAALDALVVAASMIEDAEPARAGAARLIATADPLAPLPDRDLPARQRLTALASTVCDRAATTPWLRSLAGELADLYAPRPELRALAVDLAVAAIAWDSPDTERTALRRVAAIADRPTLAAHAGVRLEAALAPRVRRLDQARLLAVARDLAAGPTPADARLALAIAGEAGGEAGWSAPWCELIAGLRRHADPDVALAALDTFTAVE
jgi:hypothetical protein